MPPYVDPYQDTSVMRVKDWVVTYLVMMIPCVGIVMMFVWAFGSSGNVNRKNYARAILILMGILIAVYIVIFVIIGATLGSLWYDTIFDSAW
jgi:hypothetical protein